eukprot:CAMPEP_0167741976 /NCGR_PEP_ID=MMETSP0110_2-20121227/1160_1 /TAXON_ID=629695 /ORGANISM="Gymnochlora sp., Strain CCMP2014" /LENGTH=956 /DNA_ID=CAMNT_0007626097 /DNA_START=149 /DNA_END=3014 /DNA_ORIENTATION=-
MDGSTLSASSTSQKAVEISLRFDHPDAVAAAADAVKSLGVVVAKPGSASNGKKRKRPRKTSAKKMKERADIYYNVFKMKLRRSIDTKILTASGKKPNPPPLWGPQDSENIATSSGSRRKKWDGSKVTVRNFLQYVQTCQFYRDQLKGMISFPGNTKASQEPRSPLPLPDSILRALRDIGIKRLYSHQYEAVKALLTTSISRHVVCSTPTSSGKSLIYTLPLSTALLKDAGSRGILLFPTKALAHDQVDSMKNFLEKIGLLSSYVAPFDGDTKMEDRDHVRTTAKVIITNPDILHCTVLPAHKQWESLLSGLKLLVIDEAHTYTGVFGNHVSLVLRRLLRLARAKGACPRVVCCSATIGNPVEHMTRLTGIPSEQIVSIDKDGSPKGDRFYGFWCPPGLTKKNSHENKESVSEDKHKRRKTEDEKNVSETLKRSLAEEKFEEDDSNNVEYRRSAYTEAAYLLAQLVSHGLRAIVFVKARHIAELVLKRARDKLPRHLHSKIASYRSGYLAAARRKLEKGMADGTLLGMVATNALELGIDIGTLDVTVHVGFPGSSSSFLQQSGRAGRGTRESLAILVALDCPIDHYLINNPRSLFDRKPRAAVADATNYVQLRTHLICGAWEMPLEIKGDIQYFGEAMIKEIQHLRRTGQLTERGNSFSCDAEFSPAKSSGGIRDICEEKVKIAIAGVSSNGRQVQRVIEYMDKQAAPFKIYEGAVYMHQGKSYVVQKLDLENGLSVVKREKVSYYTEPRHHTRIQLLGSSNVFPLGNRKIMGGVQVRWGGVNVSHRMYGYYRRSLGTYKIVQKVTSLELPPVEYNSKAVWLVIPKKLHSHMNKEGFVCTMGMYHAIEHLLIGLCPLIVTCDSLDIMGQCTRRDSDPFCNLILLYERAKGGMGVLKDIIPHMETLLVMAAAKIRGCPCEKGCPSCIHFSTCMGHNDGLDKQGAKRLIEFLLSTDWCR